MPPKPGRVAVVQHQVAVVDGELAAVVALAGMVAMRVAGLPGGEGLRGHAVGQRRQQARVLGDEVLPQPSTAIE